MKKEEIRYQQFINKLKEVSPVPENPEELTASVLASIRTMPQQKPTGKIQLITAWICGAAAIFLAGLFLLDVYRTPEYHPTETAFILPVSYTSTCKEEVKRDNIVRCFIREREDRTVQKEFLFRNLKK